MEPLFLSQSRYLQAPAAVYIAAPGESLLLLAAALMFFSQSASEALGFELKKLQAHRLSLLVRIWFFFVRTRPLHIRAPTRTGQAGRPSVQQLRVATVETPGAVPKWDH